MQSSVQAQQENIVLDTVDNADGLEQLVVVCVGLDAPIQRHLEDLQTRSRLYRGLTRAQLLAIVVNEKVLGGWLEFLGMVTFSESSDEALAEKESVQSIQKAAAKVHQEALQTQTVEESHAETHDAGAEGDDNDFLDEFLDKPMPVWDTSGNTMSQPTALLFNPFSSADEVPIAMFSMRWNERNKGTERLFRDVAELLRGRCIRILAVDAQAPDFGAVTLRYLHVLKAKRGVMLAVCTADYGEMTTDPFSTNIQLTYALDHHIEILPLKVEEIYPPQPPSGPDHPVDKHRLGELLIWTAMPPDKFYLDCCLKTKDQIADEIEAALRDRKAEARNIFPRLRGSGLYCLI
ncbi:unnamed protein product [Symbiodinium sp. CCMP2592]|nr:unnamed protein product [Symbiodinium sp. CCMP2592]